MLEDIKPEKIIIKNNKGMFSIERGFNTQDSYLYKLIIKIFDNDAWMDSVKRQLLNPKSEGITGNIVDVIIEGNKVIIEPQFADDPSKYSIEIDRQLLLNLINKWQELTEQACQEIIFTRYQDGSITLDGK